MNFRRCFIATLAVAALCSCATDPTHEMPLEVSQVEITAAISGSEVRTSLGNESSGARQVLWEEDDRVTLYDDANFAREFTLTSAAGSNTGTFTGVAAVDFAFKKYYAVYPASAAQGRTSEGVDVALEGAGYTA